MTLIEFTSALPTAGDAPQIELSFGDPHGAGRVMGHPYAGPPGEIEIRYGDDGGASATTSKTRPATVRSASSAKRRSATTTGRAAPRPKPYRAPAVQGGAVALNEPSM
ncbi:hypothetical protein [Streptomyces sp. NPDC059076]|uniref:hypothetical protein n=1 Tax=unclassified Streptomyces TaxID=2593676 RepID=UPI0036C07C82